MCKDEALMHICIHPRWLHRQKPTGFLYHCEFVKTWCMSRCIIMCTLCSLSLCAKWAVLKCIIVKKIDIKTIGVFSVAPLRCFQLVYFILFPPCCFYSVTYKLSANNFSNILQNIWYEICPKWKQKRLIIWITACNDCSLVFSALLNNFTNILTPPNEKLLSMPFLNTWRGWWLKIRVIYLDNRKWFGSIFLWESQPHSLSNVCASVENTNMGHRL